MVIVKKIGALSLAKLQAIIMAVFGLFLGILYALMGPTIIQASLAGGQAIPEVGKFIFGPWAILILPVIYGIMGFIVGLVFAGVYNLVARIFGGLKIELVEGSAKKK